MTQRPKVIGVCGLIGSGKSVVRQAMEVLLGLPSFDSDEEAKKLYFIPEVRREIKQTLGFDPLSNGSLDKPRLQECISHPEQRMQLEGIIHSALSIRWSQWLSLQTSSAVVLESAILYTSGYYKHCDVVVAVTCPTSIRRERVLMRDGEGREARFEAIETAQMEEGRRQERDAHYHLDNSGGSSVILQLEQLQDSLLS